MLCRSAVTDVILQFYEMSVHFYEVETERFYSTYYIETLHGNPVENIARI